MVNSVFRDHESSSHLSRGNIRIKSPSRPWSPLTQNESVFRGTTSRGRGGRGGEGGEGGGGAGAGAGARTHSLDNNSSDDDERQQPSLSSISSRNKGEIICDYDRSVTYLYEMLESSNWEGACDRCRSRPQEVHTWVARRDTHGEIRWKILPLHAAIIFQAPLTVVECLLKEHPIAAAKRDDQGMLPPPPCIPTQIRGICHRETSSSISRGCNYQGSKKTTSFRSYKGYVFFIHDDDFICRNLQ